MAIFVYLKVVSIRIDVVDMMFEIEGSSAEHTEDVGIHDLSVSGVGEGHDGHSVSQGVREWDDMSYVSKKPCQVSHITVVFWRLHDARRWAH